jgi:hypothetical protein
MFHEIMYFQNRAVFVTWTYANEYLPPNGSLVKRDFQLMMKFLRFELCKRHGKDYRIKYFAVGEYGGVTKRPHYHAIIFGLGHRDFIDLSQPVNSQGFFDYHRIGKDLVIYKGILKDTWHRGRIVVGFDIFSGAPAYVSGYIQKKLNGIPGNLEYAATGRIPPFQLQSKGIGKRYAIDHADRLTATLEYNVKGHGRALPRYYRKVLNIDNVQLRDHMEVYEQQIIDQFLAQYPDKDVYVYDNVEYDRRKRIYDVYRSSLPPEIAETLTELNPKDCTCFSQDYLDFKVSLTEGVEHDAKARVACGRASRGSYYRDGV